MDKSIQIVVGTYDKLLHGTIASVRSPSHVEFLDNFLFEAHTSAVRCLALSPSSSSSSASGQQKVILASGGSDEKINLYQIAASPPTRKDEKISPSITLTGNGTFQSPKNRELGCLMHHSSAVNALHFPNRSKLFSAADDNTVAIARTRDWTVLLSIKAPIPKAHGRPSGDTAQLGGTPAGVSDFAVHPSKTLMISVGKGEKCMRLWNLVTGKKAGVLNFERSLLQGVGEGKWGSGEGRKVNWNTTGDEFLVAFEKGAVLFGMDCKPKARILPHPTTKVHQAQYAELANVNGVTTEVVAVSTEDGRILLYSTYVPSGEAQRLEPNGTVPTLNPIGQIGGDLKGRIKDFEILGASSSQSLTPDLYFITASSNGAICVWALDRNNLFPDTRTSSRTSNEEASQPPKPSADASAANGCDVAPTKQFGRLLGKYDTGHRITCLKAYLMLETPPNSAERLEFTSDKRKADRGSDLVEDSLSRPSLTKKSKTAANCQATSSIVG